MMSASVTMAVVAVLFYHVGLASRPFIFLYFYSRVSTTFYEK